MSGPDLFEQRYALRRYTEQDLLGTEQDFTRIEVSDIKTGTTIIFNDRGAEGLDSVLVDNQDIADLGPWRMLYHEIRQHVRGTVPRTLYDAFRQASTIGLHQWWDGRQWQSHFSAAGGDVQGVHASLGNATAERTAPFAPTDVQITKNDPALFIHITQDAAMPWLAATTRYLGLGPVLAGATAHAIPVQAQRLRLWLPVELYHLLPERITRQPAAFHAELALALTGMMGFPKDGDTFLSFPKSTIDPAEAPLPYFLKIPIPANCPPRLRALIDANGDGFVSHINEAWHTYLLATQPAAWDPDSAAALQTLAAQLTHVAPDKSGVRIGTRVIRVRLPDTALCASAKRLFAVGEAVRSFGDTLVHQWANGGFGESALTVMPLAPSTVSDPQLRKSLWGVVEAQSELTTALYSPNLNVLVTGCSATLSDQYLVARHELGHVIDDWLSPFDDRGDAPVLYSNHQHNVVATTRSALFLQTLPAPHYHDPHEWIPFFMESSDRWRLAPPALRTVIACAVGAEFPHRCTGDHPPWFPAETDPIGYDRRDPETTRTRTLKR